MSSTKLSRSPRSDFRKRDLPIVLCVDDDRAVLESLRRLFRGEPYEVVTVASPGQALGVLRLGTVGVVIADERMPGESGSELLAEVRERWPWIGRVILTAYPGPEVTASGAKAGVDHLLTKPWDAESLKRTVERLLQDVQRTRRMSQSVGEEPSEGDDSMKS
ncbi:MAG: response regulator [Planctomycetaceae bacterium]|nr:response regulator [Planctomycetaceae bacterium]